MKPDKDLEQDRQDEEPSELLHEALSKKPLYASNEEALAGFTKQLDDLAAKMGVGVDQLLSDAESSGVFKEEYIEALMLGRRVARFRKLAGEET